MGAQDAGEYVYQNVGQPPDGEIPDGGEYVYQYVQPYGHALIAQQTVEVTVFGSLADARVAQQTAETTIFGTISDLRVAQQTAEVSVVIRSHARVAEQSVEVAIAPPAGPPPLGAALFFSEGFETYSTLAEIGTVWAPLGTLLSFNGVRTGTHGLVAQGIRKFLGAGANDTLIVGCGFRALTDSAFDMIRFLSDGGETEHVVVRRVAGGAIAIDRGSTELAITAAGVFPLGTTFFEVKVILHDLTGVIEVRKDGDPTPILSFAGDTKNSGMNNVFDSIDFIGLYDTNNGGIDDIYISNGVGSAPYDDFLGNVRSWPLYPDGNGNSSLFIGSDGNNIDNWMLVDDEPSSASAMSDTVESRTPGDKDLYTYSNVPQTMGTIFGLTVNTLAKGLNTSTTVANRLVRPVVRTGGVDYPGTDVLPGVTASVSHEPYNTNPNTGMPWTLAEVNTLEAGMEVRP